MDVSIVIPTIHDYPQIIMTINALEAEMEHSSLNFEIVMVENGSLDSYTENFLKAYRVPLSKGVIKYAFEKVQCGPAARMRGAKMAKGEYVIFMDSHTVPSRGSIDRMVEKIEALDAGVLHGATVKTHVVPPHVRGLHYRLFGNRGPCLNTHMHGSYSRAGQDVPYPCVGANLAYTMFKTTELLNLRGYHPECRYYPHPEGYLPLKYLMFGREVWADPKSYHFHSVYRNPGSHGSPKWVIPIGDDTYGLSGNDHLICNAMICAYTLGGDKWLDILYDSWAQSIRSKYVLKGIKEYARDVSQEERKFILDHSEKTLDEVLTEARRNKVKGMENWFPAIGDDPIVV